MLEEDLRVIPRSNCMLCWYVNVYPEILRSVWSSEYYECMMGYFVCSDGDMVGEPWKDDVVCAET